MTVAAVSATEREIRRRVVDSINTMVTISMSHTAAPGSVIRNLSRGYRLYPSVYARHQSNPMEWMFLYYRRLFMASMRLCGRMSVQCSLI